MHRSCFDHQCNNPSGSNRLWGAMRKNNVLFRMNRKSECKRVFLVSTVAQEFTCDTDQIHHLVNHHELRTAWVVTWRETSPSATLSNELPSFVITYSSNLQHNNVLDAHRCLKRPESTILPKFQYMTTKSVQFCPHMARTKERFGTDRNSSSAWL